MCVTIYFTTILAFIRYRGMVQNPIERYNITRNSVNSNEYCWRKILLWYVLPVVTLSVLYNIPKFFELKIVEDVEVQEVFDKENNLTKKVVFPQLGSARSALNARLYTLGSARSALHARSAS